MSMIIELRAISHATSHELFADPAQLEALFDEYNDEAQPGSEGSAMDLDKAWHAIHFLLTGTTDAGEGPIASLLVGGTEVGDEEFGYAIPRVLTESETAAFAQALANTPVEKLRARYEPEALAEAEISPEIWLEEGEGAFEYVREHYDSLRTFVTAAARNKLCLLIAML